MEKTNRILVTGSSGFVGKCLVSRLKQRRAYVVEADKVNGVDLATRAFIQEMERVDVVVHLAARMYVPFAFANPVDIYEPNILSTLNVLDYCRQRNVRKIVYASSYIYGIPEYLPVDENHPASIRNPYGRSKLIGETLCRGYYEDFGVVPVILRPFNIYGPGQNENFLIPTVVKQVLGGEKISVMDLDPRRDYVYVDDAVDAYIKAIFEYQTDGPSLFNVGFGISYSVREIIDICQKLAGTNKPVVASSEQRPNEIPDCVANIAKIERELNWRPCTDIEEGLKRTILSYKANV